jgi:hypothetical protein
MRTVSLDVFGKDALFYSIYSLKTCNFASCLNMLYTSESAQFYLTFKLQIVGLTRRCPQKRKVSLCIFDKDCQDDPKTVSYEDHAKFHSEFSVTALIDATRFQQKREVIENL